MRNSVAKRDLHPLLLHLLRRLREQLREPPLDRVPELQRRRGQLRLRRRRERLGFPAAPYEHEREHGLEDV
jgi:hypothetical protein